MHTTIKRRQQQHQSPPINNQVDKLTLQVHLHNVHLQRTSATYMCGSSVASRGCGLPCVAAMGSGLNLPLVDISPFISQSNDNDDGSQLRALEPSTSELTDSQRATVAVLRAALQSPGFFYLVGHGIPEGLMEDVVQLAGSFYEENTKEAKGTVARRDVGDVPPGDGARGWQDTDDDCTDWHEAFDFYAEIPESEIEAHRAFKASRHDVWAGVDGLLEGRNHFPAHPARLQQVLAAYIRDMCIVGTAVMHAMGHALRLEDPAFLANCTRQSFWCRFLLCSHAPRGQRAACILIFSHLRSSIHGVPPGPRPSQE